MNGVDGDRRGWARRLLHEPLLHFLLIGLALCLGVQAWRDAHDRRVIVVTPERVASLAETYKLQFGSPPTPKALEAAVAAYVREEALYREGLAMGLDRDDEVVRRRIAQKVEFLNQDRAAPRAPSEAQLRAWFDAHAGAYAAPARTSFVHLYFSPDRPGDARARAAAALAELARGAAPDSVGADPYPDQDRYDGLSAVEARRLFGEGDLAARLETAPLGAWSGPYSSGYGWHLVRVVARAPGGRAAFDTIRAQVLQDYLEQARQAENAAAIRKLVDRYRVVRRDAR